MSHLFQRNLARTLMSSLSLVACLALAAPISLVAAGCDDDSATSQPEVDPSTPPPYAGQTTDSAANNKSAPE